MLGCEEGVAPIAGFGGDDPEQPLEAERDVWLESPGQRAEVTSTNHLREKHSPEAPRRGAALPMPSFSPVRPTSTF